MTGVKFEIYEIFSGLLIIGFCLFQTMSPIKVVSKLQMMSIKSITNWLTRMPSKTGSDHSSKKRNVSPLKLVVKVLENLVKKYKNGYSTYRKIEQPEVILNCKLKHLDLSQWSQEIHYIFDANFAKLTSCSKFDVLARKIAFADRRKNFKRH